jgi:hypothetical protein
MPDSKTANLNAIRAAFMRRASTPDINPFALKTAYLIAYKYMNNESGTAHPSQETLARDLNVTTRTVRTLLDILKPLGLVVVAGHGPNRASTYWIDSARTTAGSANTEKRKPASSYKRKPASGSKANTGNLVHDNRKSDVEIPEASFRPTKKKNQEEEPIVADAQASATGERESELALADPGALAEGGAPTMKTDFAAWDAPFATLVAIWKRPHGDEDEDAAWRAFVSACISCQRDPDDIANDIIASARRWVAAYRHKPEMLKPLWKWLSNGTWKNQPPSPKAKRNAGKVSLANVALAISREEDQS